MSSPSPTGEEGKFGCASIQRKHLDISESGHHDVSMRTTLTLDEDVAEALKRTLKAGKKTFKEAVNDALRIGLAAPGRPGRQPRFKVTPHDFGFAAWIDQSRLNQLADDLEAEDAARALGR